MVKTYLVKLKEQPSIYYVVDAPNRRTAKWCGAACYANEYSASATSNDFTVERLRHKEDKND